MHIGCKRCDFTACGRESAVVSRLVRRPRTCIPSDMQQGCCHASISSPPCSKQMVVASTDDICPPAAASLRCQQQCLARPNCTPAPMAVRLLQPALSRSQGSFNLQNSCAPDCGAALRVLHLNVAPAVANDNRDQSAVDRKQALAATDALKNAICNNGSWWSNRAMLPIWPCPQVSCDLIPLGPANPMN